MTFLCKLCVVLFLVTLTSCTPTTSPGAFWKGTFFDSSVEEMRSMCAEDDIIACLKLKAITFLDSILKKDNFQGYHSIRYQGDADHKILMNESDWSLPAKMNCRNYADTPTGAVKVMITDNVEVSRNSYSLNEITSRSESSFEDKVENYFKTHDVTFKLPIVGSAVTLGARNLDSDEIDLRVNYESGLEARGKKSKLKKILIPILVFILLKAITLVPLALGILGLKAWNALQLSFFSFIVSVALAVFQLCKKIAADAAHPQITAHPPWEPAVQQHFASRSFDKKTDESGNEAQNLAYSAYVQLK